ncbi:hypothetical protein CYY_002019 [Polysphondylium violaceum]|uniref:Ankyrin repeat-containing protein n=1 Tax=Polysphondylium violaceum TaxID=133409 RepID=A0A8J4VA02_9MYCE|nr:hypothetical protein CYY_002019 [Polysphondylium violaceum]
MISFNYHSLLKDKLKRDEYLVLIPEAGRFLFSIQDVKLFAKCFKRFQLDYFPLHPYPPLYNYCAQFDNFQALQYLSTKYKDSFGGDYVALEYCASNGNLEMLKFLCETAKIQDFSTNCFVQAVKSGDFEIVQYVKSKFVDGKIEWTAKDINSVVEYSQSSLEMFKYIIKELEIELFEKEFYFKAIKNSTILEYVLETFQSPQELNIKDLAIECAQQNYIESLSYLQSKNSDLSESVAKVLLIKGYRDSFKLLFNSMTVDLSDTNLDMIKDSLISLEVAQFYIEMNACISPKTLINLATNRNNQLFHYIWKREFSQILNLDRHLYYKGQDITEGLLDGLIKTKNTTLLLYLKENYDIKLKQQDTNKLPLYLVNTNNQAFLFNLLTMIDAGLIHFLTLLKACARDHSLQVYQYLFSELKRVEADLKLIHMDNLDQIFILCAEKNNIKLAEYLIEGGIKPSKIIIEKITMYPQIELVRLFLKNGYKPTQYCYLYPYEKGYLDIIKLLDQASGQVNLSQSNLAGAIKYDRIECMEYFKEYFNTYKTTEVEYSLSTSFSHCSNLNTLKYLLSEFKCFSFRFDLIVQVSISRGYIDILRYLLSNGYFDQNKITNAMFRGAFLGRHTHMLVYLYDKVPHSYYLNLNARYASPSYTQFIEDLKNNNAPIVYNKGLSWYQSFRKYVSKVNIADVIQVFNFD